VEPTADDEPSPPGEGAVPDAAVSVRDLESLARTRLSEHIWNYVAGGAADEISLGWNDSAWRELPLAPRVLTDVSEIDTSVHLLGRDLAHPILLAPTAAHRQYHPGAEAATRRGADAAEALGRLGDPAGM